MRRVSIYIAVLVVATAAGLAAPGASAAPAPSHWCGPGESAEDRLPDAVASYQVHVVYAIPADGTDLFSQRVLPIARDLAIVDSWWRLQDSGRTPRFDLAAFPGCDSVFGALDVSVVHLPQPGAAYAAGDDSAKRAMLIDLAAALSSPAKKFIAFYDGPVVGGVNLCGFSSRGPNERGGSYSVVLLDSDPSGGFSSCGNLGAGDYEAKTEAHELLHNLGAVPDEAPHQCNGGHVCDIGDVMFPGGTTFSLFDYAMDVGHDDYYGHSGTWWDVQDSPWLAHLDAPQYPLTVKIDGEVGSVESDLPGIQCPPACSIAWDSGTQVVLTATPGKEGTHFSAFSGDCDGDVCPLTMDGPKTVTARFAADRNLHVSVLERGGRGSITGPAGLACESSCDFSLEAGTTVSLRATAAKGSRFVSWSIRSCGAKPVCRVDVDTVRSVSATFGRADYRVTTAVGGSGTVRSTPAGIRCPRTCSALFRYGASVRLTPRPAAGWRFAGWTGICHGTRPCRLRVTQAFFARATFRRGA